MSITPEDPDLALLAAAPRDDLPRTIGLILRGASIDRRGSLPRVPAHRGRALPRTDAQMAGKLIAAGADGTVPIQRRCVRLHSGSC